MALNISKTIAIAKNISVATTQTVREELKEDIQASTEPLKEEIETVKEEIENLKEEGVDSSLKETLSLHDYKIKEIENHDIIQDIYIQGLFNENSDGRITIKSSSLVTSLTKSKKGIATIDKIIGNTQLIDGTLKSTFESNVVTQEMVDSNLEKAENLGKYKISIGTYKDLLSPEEFLAQRKQT